MTAPLGRPAAYAAELIGTFALVLFIVFVLTVSGPPPNGIGIGGPNFAVVGLVHAFALMALVATLAGVCGAHFNPAVTVGMLSLRRIGLVDAAAYIVMQLAGAVLAVLVVKALMNGSATAAHFGAPAVTTGRFLEGSAVGGMVAEGIGAFFLMWAIMGMAVNPRGNRALASFVIGATLGFAVMCIAPLTGAAAEPGPRVRPGPVRRLRSRRRLAARVRRRSRRRRGARREPLHDPRHRPPAQHRRRRGRHFAGARTVRPARRRPPVTATPDSRNVPGGIQ